jgi:ketosteroid isomerase-like protein
MMRMTAFALLALGLIACKGGQADEDALRGSVKTAETAFADTMARRDFDGFASFLADDAVFITGGIPLRGKPAVMAVWKRFYEGGEAPFSWMPDQVEVLPSGSLAHTSGPVLSPDGTVVARFYSTWRKRRDGRWEIVFDNGCRVSTSATAKP